MRFWGVLLLMVSLQACATIGNSQQSKALALEEARVKAWKDQWHTTWKHHMEEALLVTRQVDLLQGHPGWSDMKSILQARQSIQFLEGEARAKTKTSLALTEWNRKWTASAHEMLRVYISLVELSRDLDEQRARLERDKREIYLQEANLLHLKLQNKLISPEAGRLVRESLQAGHEVDLANLNLFRLNEMSLYQRASR